MTTADNTRPLSMSMFASRADLEQAKAEQLREQLREVREAFVLKCDAYNLAREAGQQLQRERDAARAELERQRGIAESLRAAGIMALHALEDENRDGPLLDKSHRAMRSLRAAIDAANGVAQAVPAAAQQSQPRWRHKRTGGAYVEVMRGHLQATDDLDMAPVVVYRSEADGRVWVRPVAEFEDGRFERISGAAAPADTADTAATGGQQP